MCASRVCDITHALVAPPPFSHFSLAWGCPALPRGAWDNIWTAPNYTNNQLGWNFDAVDLSQNSNQKVFPGVLGGTNSIDFQVIILWVIKHCSKIELYANMIEDFMLQIEIRKLFYWRVDGESFKTTLFSINLYVNYES